MNRSQCHCGTRCHENTALRLVWVIHQLFINWIELPLIVASEKFVETVLTTPISCQSARLFPRYSCDKLFHLQNGNFLGLVELFAKFEPVLKEHMRRIKDDEIADHYLGKTIQNELIQLIHCRRL